jgi:hypothetical protein
MAALSVYPQNGALVRGDPVDIPVTLSEDGDPFDASGFTWRAQIRTSFDGTLVTEFTIVVGTPAGGSVQSMVTLSLTDDESRKLETGLVFDLEQLDGSGNTIRTWWICTRLNVQLDVSKDEALVLSKEPLRVEALR